MLKMVQSELGRVAGNPVCFGLDCVLQSPDLQVMVSSAKTLLVNLQVLNLQNTLRVVLSHLPEALHCVIV